MVASPIIACLSLATSLGVASLRSDAGRVVLSAEPRARSGAGVAVETEPTLLVVARAPENADPTRFLARSSADGDAQDRAIAVALLDARAVELRGGSWVDWYHASHSGRHEREWTRALRRAHAAGAEVRASGGGAAWVARWSPVPRAELGKPAQDPHDRSLDVPVEGLGLLGPDFDGVLVGVLAPGAPTADRAIERALAFELRDVLLLAGDAELAWDPAARNAHVVARSPSALIAWIDLGAGTRSRGSVRAARVTIARDGDVLELGPARLEGARESGDVALDEGLRALAERIAGDAVRAGLVLRVGRPTRDEETLRSARGGLSRAKIDLDVGAP